METAVCSLVGLIAFVYLGYPLLIALIGLLRDYRPPSVVDTLPSLTLLIPAHNEAAVIAAKLENTLGLDYPAALFEVVVISDASSDGTDDIVAGFARRDDRVRLIRQEPQAGKVAALERGLAESSGEIICFSDANSAYDREAPRRLAAAFADPEVGCACGRLILSGTDQSGTAGGEGLYWRYEDFVKAAESRSGTMLMGAGTIYAARRELIPRVPPHRADDSIVPLTIAASGRRVVWVPGAIARERTASAAAEEFRRKVRMISHDFGGYFYLKGCWKSPGVGLRLLFHKLLRWLVPVFYLAALGLAVPGALNGSLPMVVASSVLGGGLLWGVAAWWAMRGGWRPRSLLGRLAALPGHFVMVNAAALAGIWRSLTVGSPATWKTADSAHGGLGDD